MRTVNKVILIGNVTRDPLVKETENGKKIAMFSTATNRYYKTADGENKFIYIEGRLKTRVIEKDGGEKIYKTEVVVGNIIFLNKKEDFEEAGVTDDDMLDVESDDMF